jgi:hypothetical protein
MAYQAFLSRIKRVFDTRRDEHLDRISDAFLKGTLVPPVRPMSDQELARAIKEFQARPVSEMTIRLLAKRLEDKANRA